jgi:hypothetical protein
MSETTTREPNIILDNLESAEVLVNKLLSMIAKETVKHFKLGGIGIANTEIMTLLAFMTAIQIVDLRQPDLADVSDWTHDHILLEVFNTELNVFMQVMSPKEEAI